MKWYCVYVLLPHNLKRIVTLNRHNGYLIIMTVYIEHNVMQSQCCGFKGKRVCLKLPPTLVHVPV